VPNISQSRRDDSSSIRSPHTHRRCKREVIADSYDVAVKLEPSDASLPRALLMLITQWYGPAVVSWIQRDFR